MFSGIEAATVAWHPLGWTPLAFAEVEPFPSAVLKHHYPDVPNVGDMTAYDWSQYAGQCDLVVGGPPCQAFSVAGLRQSLSDDRGNLSLAYVKAIRALDPLWSLTENVPGWLSTKDNAFGCVLAGLVGASAPLVPPTGCGGRWTDAGLVTGPERTAAWRILDAQYFGLAQRRRRVFVLSVRGTGNWACARALFPVGHSLSGHPAPRRETGARIAAGTLSRALSRVGGGDDPGANKGAPIVITDYCPDIVPQAMSSKWAKGSSGPAGDEVANLVAHTLRADGFDASEDGTGRGTPIVAVPAITHAVVSNGDANSGFRDEHGLVVAVPAVLAFDTTQITSKANRSNPKPGDPCHPLAAGAHPPAIIAAVPRRLTPKECARLQGFPDEYLDIAYRGKPAADGPKYRALGNSFAVPVVAWIGQRIAQVDALGVDAEAIA